MEVVVWTLLAITTILAHFVRIIGFWSMDNVSNAWLTTTAFNVHPRIQVYVSPAKKAFTPPTVHASNAAQAASNVLAPNTASSATMDTTNQKALSCVIACVAVQYAKHASKMGKNARVVMMVFILQWQRNV